MSDRELLTECLDVLTHDAAQRTFAGGVRMSQLAIKLRAALAAPEPEQKFDHSIGADRFKVVRGIFWWHIKIGDSPTEHGKFRSSAAAQKMADDLLREFRNGAFVQNALAAPQPEPVAWMYVNSEGECEQIEYGTEAIDDDSITLLYAAPPAAAPEPESKTPAWWMDGLTATLMREGVNKHRAREIAQGYWEAYCQIPGQEEVQP